MRRFEGTVRLPGETFELSAVLLVADGRLKVTSQEHSLGDWPLADLTAQLRPDGCHVEVDGETFIATVPHPVRLTQALDRLRRTDPADDARDSLPAVDAEAEPVEPDDDPGPVGRLPATWKLGGAGLLVMALLGVFAPTALIALLLLVASALLLGGAVGYLDPFTAVRLPDLLTPLRLLGAGSVIVAVALVLAITIT